MVLRKFDLSGHLLLVVSSSFLLALGSGVRGAIFISWLRSTFLGVCSIVTYLSSALPFKGNLSCAYLSSWCLRSSQTNPLCHFA